MHDRLLPAFVYVCECALNNKIELRRQLQQQHGNGYFYGKCFDNVFVQNKSLVFVLIHKTSDKNWNTVDADNDDTHDNDDADAYTEGVWKGLFFSSLIRGLSQ